MPKTFDILKKRWPEVAFMVIFCTLPGLTSMIMLRLRHTTAMDTYHFQSLMAATSIASITVSILFIFLQTGFLRTACLYGEQRYGLWTLFKTGSPFFIWLFILFIIEAIVTMTATSIIATILYRIECQDYRVLSWSHTIVSLLLTIAILKLKLFMPSLIIVRKLNIITAFKKLKHYRLLAAKETLMLFAIICLIGKIGFRLIGFTPDGHLSKFIVFVILSLIINLLSITMMLSAVKFIDDNTETATEVIDIAKEENAKNI